MGWLDRLFGAKPPPRPPREILAEAIAEIGDPSLLPATLALFDDPRDLIERWSLEQGEAPQWNQAQLAYQVFEHVLREDHRIGYLDWADGWMAIEHQFNIMFARAGVAPVTDSEKTHMANATEGCKRGQATRILWNYLSGMGETRGLQLDWIDTDADYSYPIFMKPEAYRKWRFARFGKGVEVLP